MKHSKRALVVGGTSGIGHGIARALARNGNFHVTISGRSAERGAEIVQQMRDLSGGRSDLQFEFIPCDCFQISNIKKFTDDYAKKNDTLDVLVLTQGIGTFQGRTETSEGIDQKLALHYFGRFAFIDNLLPLLRKSESSPKVMSVLSGGVHAAYTEYKADPELKVNFSLKNAADAAGFYNDLALDKFSELPENKAITFIHAAPGFGKKF